jgi:hypothetical protein
MKEIFKSFCGFIRGFLNLATSMIDRCFEKIPGTTHGSKQRRFFTYVMIFWVLVMVLELVLGARVLDYWPGFTLALLSGLYFVTVVFGVLFLASHKFSVAPARLAFDALVSMTSSVFSFALVFRSIGFSSVSGCPKPYDSIDAVYFSAVTFSTLGYGDFHPCADARIYAALQAMLGNLHLGLIVGAAFLLASSVSNQQ